MKNLVLGALLAVASSVGCTTSDGGGGVGTTVTVRWDFTHFADGSARSCPDGFGTATIVSQTTDDTSHLGVGSKFIDKFNCSDGEGTIVLPDNDTYLVWVQIENDSGSNLYAQSDETFVDTSTSVPPVSVNIYDDAGFFFLEWDLEDATTHAPLSCTQAGLTGSSGAVEAVATLATSTNVLVTDQFTCSDHYGTTDPLLAGTYTVSVEATVNNQSIGNAPAVTKTISAPNRLTDLGLFVIPVTP